ncbi:MAG: hypothetical protein JW963_03125 [Anaerolineales bacterium]|nr:hypothetical protein [Anaerolineales bacterium]
MNIKSSFGKFNGRHWETGSVHNALALQGVVAPHTGQPFSEALLLGVSGGITFGYFGSPVFNGKPGQKQPKHANERS